MLFSICDHSVLSMILNFQIAGNLGLKNGGISLGEGSLLSKVWTHHSRADLYTVLYCSTHLSQQYAIAPHS